jgi:hypothetical protein
MSLKEGKRMRGVDHPHARWREAEYGADPRFLHIVLDAETRPERIMGDFKNIRQPGIGPVEN